MVLGFLQIPGPEIRIGLITSRRVGKAVERNKARRRFREIVRQTIPRMIPGLWIVLVARRSTVSAEFKTLEREWLSLAGRASILKD